MRPRLRLTDILEMAKDSRLMVIFEIKKPTTPKMRRTQRYAGIRGERGE
jgi:glycerol kinase